MSVMDVECGMFEDKPVCTHTIVCDTGEQLPILVLVHGYGGSAALFYKVMKPLSMRFKLILIDLIGMGNSSRPTNFSLEFSAQEAVEYFVDYLETWRCKMGITDFYLAAHSFGGFICGHYALKYHSHIRKLLLLSPIGCNYATQRENLTYD